VLTKNGGLSRLYFKQKKGVVMMKKIVPLGFVLAATLVSPALAGTTIFTGDTTGAPTYNRPIAGTPPTTLSGIGSAVRYVVTPFTVSVSGNYNFFNATGYDSYLGIHRNAFSPANGLLNAIAYNDDFNGTLDGGFANLALLAGVSYFAISTGFDSPDFGAFSLTVNGPGNIVRIGGGGGVPEPATWAMLIFGFAGIGAALRRRRSAGIAATV
jgi:PEP-CTERM motif